MSRKKKKHFLAVAVSLLAMIISVIMLSGVTASATVVLPDEEIATWLGFRKGAASFTFDTGVPSHYNDAAPVFEAHGCRATFNIVVNWTSDEDWNGFRGLAAKGHEIGSNSNSNPNNSGAGERGSSKRNINEKIDQNRGCITWAYPKGYVGGKEEVNAHYIGGRSITWDPIYATRACINKEGPDDWAEIPSLLTGNDGNIKTADDFIDMFQYVIDNDKWVVFTTMAIAGKMNLFNTYSPTALEDIDEALDWAMQNGRDLWVAPMGHVIMYVKERNASTLQKVSSDASSMTYTLKHDIADDICDYDYPLSIKIKLPDDYSQVYVQQGNTVLKSYTENGYVFFDAIPNAGNIVVSKQVTVQASGYKGTYDGQAHGITVSVIDPVSGAAIRYGKTEGVYDLDASPTITYAYESPLKVFYIVTADGYVAKTGSESVTIESVPATGGGSTGGGSTGGGSIGGGSMGGGSTGGGSTGGGSTGGGSIGGGSTGGGSTGGGSTGGGSSIGSGSTGGAAPGGTTAGGGDSSAKENKPAEENKDTKTADEKKDDRDKAEQKGEQEPKVVKNKDGSVTTTNVTAGKNGSKTVESVTENKDGSKTEKKYSVSKKGTVKVTVFETEEKKVKIPKSIEVDGKKREVNEISKNALKNNTTMTGVKIGENITSIGAGAFKNDKNLKKIELTDSVTKIYKNAFKGIAKNAVFKIKASSQAEFERVVELLKASGVGKSVRFERVE